MTAAATPGPRLLVIGLDGATYDLIRPWAEAGHLPNIARLLEGGVQAPLRSTFPPVTAPAWTSFMTGKNPGKHGLYHFTEPRPGSYELRYTNARSRRAVSLWRLLNQQGLTTGIINLPLTYPPEEVRGYLLAGMDAPQGSRAITHPPELYDEIERAHGRVSPQMVYLGYLGSDARRDAVLAGLEVMDRHYTRLAAWLAERRPTDVTMVVYTSTDTVQHFFYHYLDRSHPSHDAEGAARYGNAILDVHRRLDRCIGELVARLPGDATVALMSDHGFRPTSGRALRLNRFLEEIGCLRRRPDTAATALRRRLLRPLDRLLRTGLGPGAKARIARLFPGLRRRWEAHYGGLAEVDWTATRAFAHEVLTYAPGIFVNRRGAFPSGTVAPGAEHEELLRFLTRKLLEIKDPLTGDPLIRRVHRKEEIYSGPYLEWAPDLTIAWWDGIGFITRPSFDGGEVVESTAGRPLAAGEWGGAHALEGILLLHGPAFRPGLRLEGADIVDLAPTFLHLLGLPVPDDMDGRVLSEAFAPGFLARHGGGRQAAGAAAAEAGGGGGAGYSDGEAALVEERLRGLGYLG